MTNTTLPHWDMTTVYPGLDSAEFAAGFDGLTVTDVDPQEVSLRPTRKED